jgi:hypothetical protein
MGLPLEQFPDWPVGMTREVALAFTGVAETQLEEWIKLGVVRFRRRGPHGAAIAQREELAAALKSLFGEGGDGVDGPIEL